MDCVQLAHPLKLSAEWFILTPTLLSLPVGEIDSVTRIAK